MPRPPFGLVACTLVLFSDNLSRNSCINSLVSFASPYTQGVMRVRKRVTLMVVTVTAIFGICWGAESVFYTFRSFVSYAASPVVLAIIRTMVLFNSAVNPFVYALLNQQFSEKMKRMIFCTGSSAPMVHPTPDPWDIELANNTTHPIHTAGQSSAE